MQSPHPHSCDGYPCPPPPTSLRFLCWMQIIYTTSPSAPAKFYDPHAVVTSTPAHGEPVKWHRASSGRAVCILCQHAYATLRHAGLHMCLYAYATLSHAGLHMCLYAYATLSHAGVHICLYAYATLSHVGLHMCLYAYATLSHAGLHMCLYVGGRYRGPP
jgi:hypothetical protein